MRPSAGGRSAAPTGTTDVWRRPRYATVAVGTYRLLRQEVAQRSLGFYTASEYDIEPRVAAKSPRYFAVRGARALVASACSTERRSVELLWRGLWTYVREHKVDAHDRLRQLRGHRPARVRLWH